MPSAASPSPCLRASVPRTLLAAILLFAAIHLAWQSVLLNQRFYAHHLNPYAYSQPGLDVRRIAERAGQIAALSDKGRDIVIRVIHGGNAFADGPVSEAGRARAAAPAKG